MTPETRDAAAAVTAFTADLHRALLEVTPGVAGFAVAPFAVAAALGTVPHSGDPGRFATGVGAIRAALAGSGVTIRAGRERDDAGTLTRLVAAFGLEAAWSAPFAPEHNHPEEFERFDGTIVRADFMHARQPGARFGRGDGWVAVDLPYAGDELGLVLVVPDAGAFAAVERSAGAWLPVVAGGLAPAVVDVALPYWRVRTDTDLSPALGRLGAAPPFAVRHETYLAVDETGTEVAVDLPRPGAAAGERRAAHTLVTDRPFLYAVHHRPTGTPLTIGRILDPIEDESTEL